MKKSMKLYMDSMEMLTDLTDEEAGKLFKAIYRYELNGEESLTGVLKAVFNPFKNNIDRAKVEYKKVVERNKKNGLKGGRPITQNNPVGLSGLKNKEEITQANPKKPDKDKDKDKDKDTETKELFSLGINVNLWNDFMKHRKQLGKPVTTLARTRLINILLDNLSDQDTILNNSIQNGWSGLFALKNKNKEKVQLWG